MADIREQDLALKTQIADTDWIRLVTPTGNHRMTVGQFKDLIGYTTLQQSTNSLTSSVNTHLAEYEALGKIEYVYIPEGTQTRFDVPLRTSMFFVLSDNANDRTTIINVTRFGSSGLVRQTVVSGTVITINTNADGSAIFLTPTNAVRGFVVRATQSI